MDSLQCQPARLPAPNATAPRIAEVPLVFTLQPKRVQKKRSFCAQRPVEALIAGFGLAPPRAANRITAQLALCIVQLKPVPQRQRMRIFS